MARSRSGARRGGNGRFLWQVLLVVPPVVVLSAVSLYSLRQDRASIEADARRNASVAAAELARRIGERLAAAVAAAGAEQIRATVIQQSAARAEAPAQGAPAGRSDAGAVPSAPRPLTGLIVGGRVRLPVDYPKVPTPPPWLDTLTASQSRWWRAAADAAPGADLTAIRQASVRLAAAPVDARANVEWLLVRAETRREGALRAAEQLADLSGRYPELLTESGTPVADLALLLALRNPGGTRVPEPVVRRLESRVLEHPSFLTSALVEEASESAAGQAWAAVLEARWRANERTLGLLRGLPLDRIQSGALSLTAGDETWLAFVAALPPEAPAGESGPSAHHVTLVPAALLEGLFGSALEASTDQVPAYAAARLRLANSEWQAPGPPPAGDGHIELGSADGRLELPLIAPSDTAPVLSVALRLASPQAWPSTASPAGPVRLNAPPAVYPFTVRLILADPDALYASYRRRVWLAMGLVLAATAAALAGLASTWQAFQRQRRLTEMKSNFVSSVSHELRAPIAAVRLMSESLERGVIEGPERQREYMRVIGQECRRLSSLVENVLDFSRIDQGRTKYTFEPADVAALAAETVELMRPVAAERRVDLAWAPGAGPGGIELPRVDRQALRQALVNLIDNAVKHSPTGAEVVVGIEPGEEAGSTSGARGAAILRLFVEDHGPGIPADEHERIFEPFYRRGSELRRETPGIGIGLSIVKHVAEAHGGRVRVASSPGAGSRFTIELPCAPGPQP